MVWIRLLAPKSPSFTFPDESLRIFAPGGATKTLGLFGSLQRNIRRGYKDFIQCISNSLIHVDQTPAATYFSNFPTCGCVYSISSGHSFAWSVTNVHRSRSTPTDKRVGSQKIDWRWPLNGFHLTSYTFVLTVSNKSATLVGLNLRDYLVQKLYKQTAHLTADSRALVWRDEHTHTL